MNPTNKISKIGYFETWNIEAGAIEKSSSRLQSLLTLLFLFFINIMHLMAGGNFDDWGFLTFNMIMLVAAFTPKYLKDLSDKIPNK